MNESTLGWVIESLVQESIWMYFDLSEINLEQKHLNDVEVKISFISKFISLSFKPLLKSIKYWSLKPI
jgi:hypothetical protein